MGKPLAGALVAAGVIASWGFLVFETPQVVHVRVLAMTDFHGALESKVYPGSGDRALGGAAVLKAAMDSAEAQCDCPTLRVDAGDQMQGTLPSNLFFGATTVRALNVLGLDAAALGNHELDWTVDTLRQRISEAEYPWLAANVFDSLTGRRPEWARPYHIMEFSGLRVAFIGFMTSATKEIVFPPRVVGLSFGRGRAPIEDVLEAVRAERPDLTILAAHAGMTCDGTECSGEIVSLARELDPDDVDLIVAGHSHNLGTTEVNGIPIIQTGANGTALGIADLFRVEGGRWRAELNIRRLYADEVTPDASMLAVLDSYRSATDSVANRTVVTLRDAPIRRDGENELTKIIADALYEAAQPDLAFMGDGGIRATLPAGPITYGMLYAVMPFGNELMRLTMSGRNLRRFLEQALGRGQPSGLQITYDPARGNGRRIVDARFADGRAIEDGGTYTLAVGAYMSEGGDGFTILRDQPREAVGIRSLDALVAYLESAPQPFSAPRDRRVMLVN